MSATAFERLGRGAAAVVLAAALFSGQAMTDTMVPSTGRDPAGGSVGRAGFAYMTGLRRFAAMVLFNRLDPQYHEYYGDKAVDELHFLMPSFHVITWLDPQFVQPYYTATWILYRNGRKDDSFALAAESVRNNPSSGLLRVSYAQMLYIAHRDVDEQVRQCDAAMGELTLWTNTNEQWEAMRIVEDIYAKAGYPEKAARARAISDQIDVDPTQAPGFHDSEQF